MAVQDYRMELEFEITAEDLADAWRAHNPFVAASTALGPSLSGGLIALSACMLYLDQESLFGWISLALAHSRGAVSGVLESPLTACPGVLRARHRPEVAS